MAHVYNSSTQEAKAEGSHAEDSHGYTVSYIDKPKPEIYNFSLYHTEVTTGYTT